MAEEPPITPSGETLYQRVASVMRYDEEEGFVGRYLCEALMAMIQDMDQIVLDTETHPGWCTIVDPTVCPGPWLNWCAQLYGVTLIPNSSEAEKRRQIEELPPQKRGRLESMVSAAERTLTGAKQVNVIEQNEGHAYQMKVRTDPSETASGLLTEEALLSQKPGGINLVYEDASNLKWSEATKKWKNVGSEVVWGIVSAGQV